MEKSHLQCVAWVNHSERLKEPITRIGKNANDPDLYHHINEACLNERAFLFLVPDGFFILWPRIKKGNAFIEVTVASCYSGNATQKHLPHIIRLAKCGKAKYIEFATARRGFNKIAPKQGWVNSGVRDGLIIWRHFLGD